MGANDTDTAGEFSPTTRSLVVARLKDEILSGRTPSGTRLRQADVAARFGISTTPVREAFRELATLGLVKIEAHRGATVLRFSNEELSHLYEVRMMLEPMSVAWAAQRITRDELAQANSLVESMRRSRNAQATAALNRRFHALLAQACGNHHLGELVINLLDLSTPYIVRVADSSAERAAHQMSEHVEILRACEMGDAAAAYQASLRHIMQLGVHLGSGETGTQPLRLGFEQRWLPFDLTNILEAESAHKHPRKRRRRPAGAA